MRRTNTGLAVPPSGGGLTAAAIAALPTATAALGGDQVPVNEAGTAKTVTLTQIRKFVAPFNVMDYGATGNGTTDDTAAINLAIAALNTATAGILYVPHGSYLCSAGLTPITANAIIQGDGRGYATTDGDGATVILCSSATAKLITLAAPGILVRDIGLRNTAVATPSAGSTGIYTAHGDLNQYDNVAVGGFYVNIDSAGGAVWKMTGCWLVAPILYDMRIAYASTISAGDWSITDCWFIAGGGAGTSGLRLESSGGGRITNCKWNSWIRGTNFVHGIDINFPGAAFTGDLLISHCSIENYTGNGINGSVSGGGVLDLISILGCQWEQTGNATGHAVAIDGTSGIVISDWQLTTSTGTPTAFVLSNGAHAFVGPGANYGFTTLLSTTSFLDLIDLTIPFDAVAPSTQAFGDSASPGTVNTASHRDHKHAMPANPIPAIVNTHYNTQGPSNYPSTVTVDRFYFSRIYIPIACPLTGLIVSNENAVAGNIRVALGLSNGTVVTSSVSTPSAGPYSTQSVAFTSPYAAVAGFYYLCFISDSASGHFNLNATPWDFNGYSTPGSFTVPGSFTPPTTLVSGVNAPYLSTY